MSEADSRTDAAAGLAASLSPAEWLITEDALDLDRAGFRETLFTVGNGHLGTRGTLEEGHAGERSGTFVAGVYDDHEVSVIDLVNAPDWLGLAVVANGVRLDVRSCQVLSHTRALDLRQGLLWRRTVFADDAGNQTQIESLRFASFADRHLAAIRYEVTALNYDGTVTVEAGLDGRRRNLDRLPAYAEGTTFDPEVQWEKWALAKHLTDARTAEVDDAIYLQVRTISTGIELGYAARLLTTATPSRRAVRRGYEHIELHQDFALSQGVPLRLDKMVTIMTSRPSSPAHDSSVQSAALSALEQHAAAGFDASLAASEAVWASMWADCDCTIDGDDAATQAVRFSVYQLLIAANPDDPTVNIGAKSMTGEGYRGHVFWDTEVLMLPFFIFTRPATALSLLRYRHHTLPAARELAVETGSRGARYPWESADTGREECPRFTNDGLNRFWTRDEEIHVSADVAYGIISYVTASGDEAFLLDHGAEILFETSRFWASRAEADPDSGRFSLKQVMGPDEFHSHVDDNAFTNRLAQWSLLESARVHGLLAEQHPEVLAELSARIGLDPAEVDQWRRVAAGLVYQVDPANPVIEQFAGYFDRLDVPITSWDDNDMPRYPEGYHHFNCEETMLLKQPDVIMLMHMLPDEFEAATKHANFEFYEARTLHKSSLSPAIHAIMGIEVGDATRAVQYFRRSAFVDLSDNQGNTQEGVHIASAGGTWQILVYGFGGFRVRHDQLTFNPWLPPEWQRIHFRLHWRGRVVDCSIGHTDAVFTLEDADGTVTQTGEDASENVLVRDTVITLPLGQPVTVDLT